MGYSARSSGVASILLALVISACGGASTPPVTTSSASAPSASASAAAASAQKGTGKVVFVGGGGTTQNAMDQAFLKPFAEKYGVTVDQGANISLARVKAAVLSGHPDFDVATINQADYYAGLTEGLWAPIDYSYFRPEDVAAMSKEVRLSHGVGNISYANNLVFNTKLFPSSGPQPTTWADFWDVKKFPGKRGLPGCTYSARTSAPEDALLADGVPADKLYPLDIDRALNKMKVLAPNVVWYDASDTAMTLTASGDESMALGPNGRAQVLIDKGAPIQLVWRGARVSFDVWVILKGAPNLVEAQKLVAFMSQPDPQAKMAQLTAYGPSNPLAFKSIDAATKQKLVPEGGSAGTFLKDDQWWQANGQKWIDACKAALGR